MVNRVFKTQIRINVKVYVDDMIMKIIEAKKHIEDPKEALYTLERYRMKLNLAKCAFGVLAEKFLGL